MLCVVLCVLCCYGCFVDVFDTCLFLVAICFDLCVGFDVACFCIRVIGVFTFIVMF